MANNSRLQFGGAIIEISGNAASPTVLLTVSKERYDEDAVQIRLPGRGAVAVGQLLCELGMAASQD